MEFKFSVNNIEYIHTNNDYYSIFQALSSEEQLTWRAPAQYGEKTGMLAPLDQYVKNSLRSKMAPLSYQAPSGPARR